MRYTNWLKTPLNGITEGDKEVVYMDFIGMLVKGDMLATIVNVITVVITLDFISNFAYALRIR